jgi:hypothetical protein
MTVHELIPTRTRVRVVNNQAEPSLGLWLGLSLSTHLFSSVAVGLSLLAIQCFLRTGLRLSLVACYFYVKNINL